MKPNNLKPGKVYTELAKHISKNFEGHKIKVCKWEFGPIVNLLPNFRILEISPGPKSPLWNYVTLGTWELHQQKNSHVEFILASPESNEKILDLMAMTAYYHSKFPLGIGHTFPIGEPWLENSHCDHMLVSLPYPYSEELEICMIDQAFIHFYWLLPITKVERDLKMNKGLESLEELFDNNKLEYWKVDRDSII
jgi:hypothetical protein